MTLKNMYAKTKHEIVRIVDANVNEFNRKWQVVVWTLDAVGHPLTFLCTNEC